MKSRGQSGLDLLILRKFALLLTKNPSNGGTREEVEAQRESAHVEPVSARERIEARFGNREVFDTSDNRAMRSREAHFSGLRSNHRQLRGL